MGWIERAVDRTLETKRETLTDELAEITADVKSLRREREQIGKQMDLTDEVVKLKTAIADLKIEKSRAEEEQDRKVRDTEHRVGLLKIQQGHEVTNAKRETELAVREENLTADKQRFAEEMEFQRKHLQGEVDRIESVLVKVLERLPNVDVAMRSAFESKPATQATARKVKA